MIDEDFTTDDLYNEIEKYISAGNDDKIEPYTRTRPEVCKEFSISRERAAVILGRMVEAGVLERWKVNRFDGWEWMRVRGYRLVK